MVGTETGDVVRAASVTFCVLGTLLYIPDLWGFYIRINPDYDDEDGFNNKDSRWGCFQRAINSATGFLSGCVGCFCCCCGIDPDTMDSDARTTASITAMVFIFEDMYAGLSCDLYAPSPPIL